MRSVRAHPLEPWGCSTTVKRHSLFSSHSVRRFTSSKAIVDTPPSLDTSTPYTTSPFLTKNGWKGISRRHSRQLQQKMGPLWRYQVLARYGSPSTNENSPSTPTAVPRISARNGKDEAVVYNDTDPTQSVRRSPLASADLDSEQADDPLIEFIENNQEDAAVLLAMWVSVKRSCLYGSEISEQLSLRVRYVFHSLLEHQAVAAAWRLYERLVGLGVSLKHNDLVFLLTSLPYESAANANTIEKWIQEGRQDEKDKIRRRSREKEWEQARQKTKIRQGEMESLEREKAAPATKEEPVENTVDLTPVEALAQEDTPEWVKRWALYEASMGNINLFGEEVEEKVGETSPNVDGESIQASEEAVELLKLTAVVDHLHILHAFSTTALLGQLPSAAVTPSHRSITVLKRGGAFKEHSSGFYSAEALRTLKQFIMTHKVNNVAPPLPSHLLSSIRDLVRFSSSKTAYQYVSLIEANYHRITPADGLLFLQLSVEDQPWQKQAKVERFLFDVVFPSFHTAETAASYAVRALCFSYLCRVKSTRPDDFVMMMSTLEVFLQTDQKGSPSWDTATIFTLAEQATQMTQLAVSNFSVEVKRWKREKKAEQILLSSRATNATGEEKVLSRGEKVSDVSVERAASVPSASLPPEWLDVLLLLCSVIPQVISTELMIRRSNKAESSMQLHSFLENVLYGPDGIATVSYELYRSEISLEKTLVSIKVASCFLQAAHEICKHPENISTKEFSSDTVKLLLEFSQKTLDHLPPASESSCTTVLALAKYRKAVLSLFRGLPSFFPFSSPHQKSFKNATATRAVECVILLTRILYTLEQFFSSPCVEQVMDKNKVNSYPAIHCRSVGGNRRALQQCFSMDSALGRQVRAALPLKEWQWATKCFNPKRKTHGAPRRPVDLRSELSLEKRVALREQVYPMLLEYRLDELEEKISDLLKGKGLSERMYLFHLLFHDFCVAKDTFSVEFFNHFLQTGEEEAPNLSLLTHSVERNHMWLRAVDVYWGAVDHTARLTEVKRIDLHERSVLEKMLPFLLQYSMTVGRRDIGRQWRRTWSSKYTAQERERTKWVQENVRALSILKDSSALEKSVKLLKAERSNKEAVEEDRKKEEVLLRTAAEAHRDWKAALKAITEVYGDFASHEDTINPYPLPVAHSLLRILRRADCNLSNTGLRLRDVQHTEWDLEASLLLMEMLLQSRRWKKALEVAEETSRLPQCLALQQRLATATPVEEAELDSVLSYLSFLTAQLRGCAIGGQREAATKCFDEVQRVIGVPIQPDEGDKDEIPKSFPRIEKRFDLVQSAKGKQKVDSIHELVSKARRYFLRAMTKDMIKKNAPHRKYQE